MGKQRHNAALVVGSILGGLAGAGAALWKTPVSGAELRARITGLTGSRDSSQSKIAGHAPPAGSTGASWRSSKVLGAIERVTAPIVGVPLGRTANDGSTAPPTMPGADTAAVPVGSASGEPTSSGIGHVASTSELLTPDETAKPSAAEDAARESGSFNPFPHSTDPDRPAHSS